MPGHQAQQEFPKDATSFILQSVAAAILKLACMIPTSLSGSGDVSASQDTRGSYRLDRCTVTLRPNLRSSSCMSATNHSGHVGERKTASTRIFRVTGIVWLCTVYSVPR